MTMTLAMPTPPTSRAIGAEAEEQAVVGAFGDELGFEDVGGEGDRDHGRGVGRVDGGGQHGGDGVDLAGHAAEVQLGGVAVEAEVLLGDGEADEGHAVHLGDAAGRG